MDNSSIIFNVNEKGEVTDFLFKTQGGEDKAKKKK
jgi:hypothetical protein